MNAPAPSLEPPVTPQPYLGLIAGCLVGFAAISAWALGWMGSGISRWSHPAFLISQAIVVGLLVRGLQDWRLLAQLQGQLAPSDAPREAWWVNRLSDECLKTLPANWTWPMAEDALEFGRQRLELNFISVWLLVFALPLMAIPLLGFVASIDSLGPFRSQGMPILPFGPFVLTTFETLLVGGVAVWNVGRWCQWFNDWKQAVQAHEIAEQHRDYVSSEPSAHETATIAVGIPDSMAQPAAHGAKLSPPIASEAQTARATVASVDNIDESPRTVTIPQKHPTNRDEQDAPSELEDLPDEYRAFLNK